MDKRYQVFVSSTYEDLRAERLAVIQKLLEIDCIPAGMELFPAADEDQWTLIKGVIDDCDYYVVVVAGRYGSVDEDGVSYTEKEYRYALETGKPIIAFLHRDPGSIESRFSESEPHLKKLLEAFRELCRKKMCKDWSTPDDLGGAVSSAISMLIKRSPGVGWIRADQLPAKASSEILKLRHETDNLRAELERLRTKPPSGTDELDQGDDLFRVRYKYAASKPDPKYLAISITDDFEDEQAMTWNEIFSVVSPLLINEASERSMRSALSARLSELHTAIPQGYTRRRDAEVVDEDFQTIKIQLRALGLIIQSERPRSVKDSLNYWTLTPYGDTLMTQLRAIRRG